MPRGQEISNSSKERFISLQRLRMDTHERSVNRLAGVANQLAAMWILPSPLCLVLLRSCRSRRMRANSQLFES